MPCVHNQNKIKLLTVNINQKKTEVTNLKSNITKCQTISKKHDDFNVCLDCVISKLSDTSVEANKSYDKGKMTKCLESSKETIEDCKTIISESNKKITSLESEILSLEQSIASLQGSCYDCIVAEEQTRYGGRRRVTK